MIKKAIFIAILFTITVSIGIYYTGSNSEPSKVYNSNLLSIAVLGDSDSHSYRDKYDNKARGGNYHSVTFNWPALWDRFRSDEINLGAYGVWGSEARIAKVKYWLGLSGRTPKKLDFEYNYAYSGARCRSLLKTWPYQARSFMEQLKKHPKQWDNGLVIIRIGVNDLGQEEEMDRWAQTGLDKFARDAVAECVGHIVQATNQILEVHASVRVALIGICRDYNITTTFENWPHQQQVINIEEVLNHFDESLMNYAKGSDRVDYLNDYQWLVDRFGSRLTNTLRFKTTLANKLTITNDKGDHPSHLVLKDNHAGTVYNGLWLNNMISQLDQIYKLNLTPLTEEEIYSVISPAL